MSRELSLSQMKIGTAEALELLGAEEVEKGGIRIGNKVEGYQRYVFKNLAANREYKSHLAQRYAAEMVRGKWELNGESIIRDSKGNIHNGQHRLIGLLHAEALRKADPEHYAEAYAVKSPVKIDAVFIDGIAPKAAKTIDTGQPQSGGDLLYRERVFAGGNGEVNLKEGQLAKELAVAARLVWIQAGDKVVSDAPRFPHSEMLDFLTKHPLLVEAVKEVAALDSEEVYDEAEESGSLVTRRIRQYISLGYAAGLFYLFAASETDPDQYVETGLVDISEDSWSKAKTFFEKLASGEGLAKGDPVLALSRALNSEGISRNDKVALFVKAWLAFDADEKIATLKLTKAEKARESRPRVGGIDNPREPQEAVTEEI